MRQDEGHRTSDDIFVGIDLATRQHQVVILDSQGQRLTSFKVPHTREGLNELVQRCTSPLLVPGRGRARFAFEATGHVWEAVAAFLEEQHLEYQVVNPLATVFPRQLDDPLGQRVLVGGWFRHIPLCRARLLQHPTCTPFGHAQLSSRMHYRFAAPR